MVDAILGISIAGLLAHPGAARAEHGALSQRPGTDGCISQGGGEMCTDADLLFGAFSVAVSGDGLNAYVALADGRGVASLARNAITGALTQLASPMGCISEDAGAGACTPGIGLRSAASVTVSRDGRNVYVASQSDAVAVFARNDETGALSQLPEPQGCVSQSGSGGHCTQGKALDGAHSVALSKDGRFVYVASEISRAVAVFARNKRTGALTQLPGEDGCVSENGSTELCTDGVGLGGPVALAVSPNGRNVYAVSSPTHQLAVLARDRRTGTLRPVHCITDDGSVVCSPAVAFRQPFAVTVSPDSKRVYVAARDDDAVAVFASDRKTGSLTQLPAPDGCVSDDGAKASAAS